MKRIKIPKRGDAKVAFFGVEIDKAYPFILGSMLGVLTGMNFDLGFIFYLGIPYGGYLFNKAVIQWQDQNLPGAVRTGLFALGLRGINCVFNSKGTVFIGDSQIINKANSKKIIREGIKKWN